MTTAREQALELPLTIADWAATEGRFQQALHAGAGRTPMDGDLLPFHEFLALAAEEREGKQPFIYMLESEQRLGGGSVSSARSSSWPRSG